MTAETKVGLFTFLGLILLGASIYLLGNFSISSGYDISVHFRDVSGLPAKSNVRLNGVDVGKVKELKIVQGNVVAIVRINEGVVVYRDAKFTIAATSLIGTSYLQIEQGTPQSGVVQAGDSLQGISAPSISDMVSQTMDTINNLASNINANGQFAQDLGAVLQNLRQLSGNLNELIVSLQPHLTQSFDDVSEITESSKELLAQVEEGQGLLTALMKDEEMKQDVKQTLANVKQVSEDAKKFIGRMATFRMFWIYDMRLQPNGGFFESDLSVKFMPSNGYTYYRVGIADMGNRDNLPRNDKDFRGDPNQIDARLGLYNQWADIAVGMVRGSGGAVVSLKPFYNTQTPLRNISVYGEGTDFGRNRVINNRLFDKPNLALGASADITKNIALGVRYDDMLEAGSLQFTGTLTFEDKELASLLGIAKLAN